MRTCTRNVPCDNHCSRRASILYCFNFADLLVWNTQAIIIDEIDENEKPNACIITKFKNKNKSNPLLLPGVLSVCGGGNRHGRD